MHDPLNRLLAALTGPPDAGAADAELLARAADGEDRVALELVVRRHADLVWRVCRAVARDRDAAEDAFQAAFLALVRTPGAVRERSAAGWLHRVAYRAARRARGRPPTGDVTDRPSTDPGPPELAARAEQAAAAHAALSRLPEKYRVPVVLCHLEGYTQAEAARQLGLPLGTVAVRVKRGLDRLRSHLAGVPAAVVLGVGAAEAGHLGAAAPAPVIFRACQVATGAVTPPPAVAALAAAVVAGGGDRLVALTAALVVSVSVGIAVAAGSGPREPSGAETIPPAPAPVPLTTAESPPARSPDPVFLAYPVTTDLQRVLLGGDSGVGTVVFVSRAAVGGGDDPDGRGLAPLREALAADRVAKDRPILFRCPKADPAAPRERRPDGAADALTRLGRAAGFASMRFSHAPGTLADDWAAAVREARAFRPVDGGEAGVAAGEFVAYPVRTTLSRLLAGGADCVIVPAPRSAPSERGEDGLATARAAVQALPLPARDAVLVLSVRRGGDDRKPRLAPALLADALGFGRAMTRPGPEPPDHHGRGPHPPDGR